MPFFVHFLVAFSCVFSCLPSCIFLCNFWCFPRATFLAGFPDLFDGRSPVQMLSDWVPLLYSYCTVFLSIFGPFGASLHSISSAFLRVSSCTFLCLSLIFFVHFLHAISRAFVGNYIFGVIFIVLSQRTHVFFFNVLLRFSSCNFSCLFSWILLQGMGKTQIILLDALVRQSWMTQRTKFGRVLTHSLMGTFENMFKRAKFLQKKTQNSNN